MVSQLSSIQAVLLLTSSVGSVAFHDGLDFVAVHETLIEDLRSALASVRARQSLEMQVDTIAKEKASNLAGRKAFYNVSSHQSSSYTHILIQVTGVQVPRAPTVAGQGLVCRGYG